MVLGSGSISPGEDGPDGEPVEVLTERLRKRLGTVRVPKDLSVVHPAVAALLKRDDREAQKYAGLGWSWHKPILNDPHEKRRLTLINGLFLGFAKVGGTGWLRGREERDQELSIQMGDSSVSFRLGKIQNSRRGRTQADAPDRLTLSIEHRASLPGVITEWRDEDGSRLEQRLAEIIVGMALAGYHLHQHRLAEHARWKREYEAQQERERQQQIAEAKRKEEERIAALAKARIDGLINDAAAWRDAANIRAYVAAVRDSTLVGASPADLEAWATWALAEADRLDPIASRRIRLPELEESVQIETTDTAQDGG